MSSQQLRIALNLAITMCDLDIVVDHKATDVNKIILNVLQLFVFFPLFLVTQYSICSEIQTIIQNLKLGFPTANSITEKLVVKNNRKWV